MKAKKFVNAIKKVNPDLSTNEYRVLSAIKVGDYYLSIQGSVGHYCSPRLSLSDIEGYSDMELAILNKKKEFFNISLSKTIRNFPRYRELMERADGKWSGCTIVFGYVPVDLINDLYLYLNKN